MNVDPAFAALLRDLHPPGAPPWWPLAPGWWIALAVALALAIIAARQLRPRWRRFVLRRRLLAELEAAAGAAEISQILRAAALARFPEHRAAGLHGADWIAFLEARDRAPGRFAALRAALTEMPYRAARAGDDVAPLREAARGWLRAAL
ncbi:MAG: DUF4381 domain-containing protein [Betaproteobacteria bacterium]